MKPPIMLTTMKLAVNWVILDLNNMYPINAVGICGKAHVCMTAGEALVSSSPKR